MEDLPGVRTLFWVILQKKKIKKFLFYFFIVIYADLPGQNFNGGTVPPNILQTTERPDVVFVNYNLKEITLLELTCSYETNTDSANIYKSTK